MIDSIIADYGCQNGEISIALEDNNQPYAFHWDNGQSEEEIVGLSAGEYQATIMDNSGCKHKYESPGVYLYRVLIDSPCGWEEKKGQVLLLR